MRTCIFLNQSARLIVGLTCVMALTMTTNGRAFASTSAPSSEEAPGRPMTRAEVRKLYSGKTWSWAHGGGYLDESGRFYAAVGQDHATGSYAHGSWLTTKSGRLCFAGLWRSAGKGSYDRTCFAHRVDGDAIFQRREPSGSWYAFKNSPPRSEDEFGKLVDGDQVFDQLKQIKAASAPQ